jgi:hypothetical protein
MLESLWRARRRLVALALGASLLAAVAPAAASSQAQIPPWDPFGPDIPGPLFPPPGGIPGLGPLPFPGPLPGPAPAPGGPTGSGLTPTQQMATGVAQQAMRAMNRGDVSGVVVLLAEDATYQFSDNVGLCAAQPCVGREAIRRELERQVGQHARFNPLGGDTTGTHVIGLWDIRSDRLQSANVQRLLGVITAELRGDRIVSMRVSLVRDDPQTQQFITWAQGQAMGTTAAPGTAVAPAAAPTVQMPAAPVATPATAPPAGAPPPPPATPAPASPEAPFAAPPGT